MKRIKRLFHNLTQSQVTLFLAIVVYIVSTALVQQTEPEHKLPVVDEVIIPQEIGNEKIAGASAIPVPDTDLAPDTRVVQLRAYLRSRNSPLVEYAPVFVEEADKNNLDWRLVAAITGIESSFGLHMIDGTHNGYGWGGGTIYFDSWNESIAVVSKALREKYIDRGAYSIEAIGRIYAPPSTTWASKVTYFMNEIDTYTPQSSYDLAFAF